MIKIWHYR